MNSKKAPKAAWEILCIPKEEGGLGVIDLKKHNEALLLKNLDKFFNKRDIPWVSLVWEKLYSNGKLPNHIRKDFFWWRDILMNSSLSIQLKFKMARHVSFGQILGFSSHCN